MKVVNTAHREMMEALQSLLPGTVFQVFCWGGAGLIRWERTTGSQKMSSSQVRRELHKLGSHSYRAAHKPLLTVRHVKRRLQFALDHQSLDFSKV